VLPTNIAKYVGMMQAAPPILSFELYIVMPVFIIRKEVDE
jgi:hypothetical protein